MFRAFFSNPRLTYAFELRLLLIQLRACSHSEEKTDSNLLCVGNFVDDGYMRGTVAPTMVCFISCMYAVCSTYVLRIHPSLCFPSVVLCQFPILELRGYSWLNFAVPFPHSGHFWPYMYCGFSLTTVLSVVHVLANGCARGLFSKTLQIITLLGVSSLTPFILCAQRRVFKALQGTCGFIASTKPLISLHRKPTCLLIDLTFLGIIRMVGFCVTSQSFDLYSLHIRHHWSVRWISS